MNSYMKEVAKLLGVDLEEPFRLERYDCYFQLTEEDFEQSFNGVRWSTADSLILKFILNGRTTIKKLPWKPKYGEEYYIPSISNVVGYNNFHWKGDDTDMRYYNLGLIFKSKEEAIALGQKMLAVAKEKNNG